MSLLFRASTRYLLQHRLQCALALSGIALGVAIVIGIQLTQLSAREAFAASLAGLEGNTSHTISAAADTFSEHHLASVRRLAPHWHPQPVVSGRVRHGRGDTQRTLQLVGIDPLTLAAGTLRGDVDVRALMRTPGTVVMNARTAAALGVRQGDALHITAANRPQQFSVLALLPASNTRAQMLADNVLLSDIATAQEALDLGGRLSRIELTAAPADTEATLATLQAALAAPLEVSATTRNRAGAEQLTRAFYTNLDALSLLALLVGGFMIYNTMAFLVIQRRTLYSRLRALGVSPRAIVRQVATEALLLGLGGGIIGNALGYALARALMHPLTQTLSDHYDGGAPATTVVAPGLILFGLALALVTSLIASLPPALAAARSAPAVAMNNSITLADARRSWRRCAHAGLALLLVAALLLTLSSRSLDAGFAALGCVLLGATLVSPYLLQSLLAFANGALGGRLPLPERLAARGAARAMNRLGMAAAALLAATATSIGVALMVDSFRAAVDDWLDQLLRADIYVSSLADGTPLAAGIHAELVRDKRVIASSRVRRERVSVDGTPTRLTAYDLPAQARAGFRFIAGEPATIWRQWDEQPVVLVSEPYAWHHRISVGDVIALPTPAGTQPMTVVGVYTDYASERGVVAISWRNYSRYWPDEAPHSIGLYLHEGVAMEPLRLALEQAYADNHSLVVWTEAAIKAQSMAVFDRTFAVTDVLTLFAAIIAALGVFNALLALNLERARDYAILRASGAPVALLRRMLHAQTLFVCGFALALAVPLGSLIAMLLIEIINVRSFGWSMPFSWHTHALVLPLALACGGALAAGIYPAERAVRTTPAAALRYE